MRAIVGRTRRWLEALADHEARKGRTYGTAAAYGHADDEAQGNGPGKYSEALGGVTDKTDKNLARADAEVVNETLARCSAKAESQVASNKAPDEM